MAILKRYTRRLHDGEPKRLVPRLVASSVLTVLAATVAIVLASRIIVQEEAARAAMGQILGLYTRAHAVVADANDLAEASFAPIQSREATITLRRSNLSDAIDQLRSASKQIIAPNIAAAASDIAYSGQSLLDQFDRTGAASNAQPSASDRPAGRLSMAPLFDAQAVLDATSMATLRANSIRGSAWRTNVIHLILGLVVFSLATLTMCGIWAVQAVQQRWVLLDHLALSRSAIGSAQRTRSRFLQAVGHDLRQPSQALALFVAGLERRTKDPQLAPMIEGLKSSLASLGRMLTGLMDMARLDGGTIEARVADVVLDDILDPIRTEFDQIASAKGLALTVSPAPLAVRTDAVMLECILRNLVSNAVRYTARGCVTVICEQDGKKVLIKVSDTGPGIAALDQGQIFQEFYRAPATARATDGLGLGLTIVARMIDLLAETSISLHSAVGQGSTFTITAPLGSVRPVVVDAVRPAAAPQPRQQLAGASILLVDDDDTIRASLAAEFEASGMSVASFASPSAVLAAFEHEQAGPFDVALVDLDLRGDLTGPELLDRLALTFGVVMPAIVLSGTNDFDKIRELEEGDYPWLAKPVDMALLLREMARVTSAAPQPCDLQWETVG